MSKLIACMPVRNEEWILEKTLGDLSTYVDEIVIVDDGSTDRTPEIIRSFDKVTAIHTNPPGTLPFNNGQESTNRNKTLELARSRGAEWILQIDADEMFESRVGVELPKLLKKGCSAKFQICHLWNDIDHFRVDGEWGNFVRYRLYRLHGRYKERLRYSPQPIIATPKAYDRRNKVKSDLRIVHYGWINPSVRERSLRRYFEVFKLKYPQRKVTFEQFANSTAMQSDLRIVKQEESDVKLRKWAEIMGKEDQEKYRL